jgi:hypothetical protein
LNGPVLPRASVSASFRNGWLKNVGVAIGGAGGAAVALGGYEILRSQPDKSFQLLQVWGPAFLVSLLAITVGGKFLDGMVQAIRESFTMVATSVHDSAEAAGRTADALTRLADQGGKSAEEVRRLAIYAAQEFPGIYTRLDKQDEVMQEVMSGVKGLHSMLSKEKAALDLKEARDGNES